MLLPPSPNGRTLPKLVLHNRQKAGRKAALLAALARHSDMTSAELSAFLHYDCLVAGAPTALVALLASRPAMIDSTSG